MNCIQGLVAWDVKWNSEKPWFHILIVGSMCLTAEECFLLGRLSYNEKDLYHTILWMQEALDIDKAADPLTPSNRTVERKEILDYLSYAMAVVSFVGLTVFHRRCMPLKSWISLVVFLMDLYFVVQELEIRIDLLIGGRSWLAELFRTGVL